MIDRINKNYWLALFTVTSWNEALNSKNIEVGFNEKQIKQAEKIQVGDILISYLTKVSRFISILEVTGKVKVDKNLKWSEGVFPVRVPAKSLIHLSVDQAIKVSDLIGSLSFLKLNEDYTSARWTAHIRSSPRRWKPENGEAVWNKIELRSKGEFKSDNSIKIEKIDNERKYKNFKNNNIVQKINRKTKHVDKNFSSKAITKILSSSKVTGSAVNFPILKTCRPTEVCLKTCYFSVGLNTSQNALNHQLNNYYNCIENPEKFADHVIREYDNNALSFLRWNGGGDLFIEAVNAIEFIRVKRPDIILWIVSRRPEIASQIKYHKNHFIHLSIDRSTIDKIPDFKKLFTHENVFFSYQVHPDESLSFDTLKKVQLVFMHDYNEIPSKYHNSKNLFCPLNGSKNINNVCFTCRRCFDGSLQIE